MSIPQTDTEKIEHIINLYKNLQAKYDRLWEEHEYLRHAYEESQEASQKESQKTADYILQINTYVLD